MISSHIFIVLEVGLLSLGVASLRHLKDNSINCSLPEIFAYGSTTFRSRHLRPVSIATDGVQTNFKVSQLTHAQREADR